MVIFLFIVLNISVAAYFLRIHLEKNYIYTLGDVKNVHLVALEGCVFYINEEKFMYCFYKGISED